MRKGSVIVLVGLATVVAASARAEVNLTHKRAALREIKQEGKRGGTHAPTTGEVGLIDGSGLEFFINTDITFSTVSSASGAASEASYTGAVNEDTVGGGTVAITADDAFDGYNTLFAASPGGPSQTAYNQNGPAAATCFGTGTQTNRELIYDAQLIGTSVSVRRRVFVPENDAFARWLDVFTNVGTSVASVSVSTANNLGSDADTTIVTSSNGNATAETSDTWITTFDNFAATTGTSDPRLGHVLQGAGVLVAPVQQISFVNGDDNPSWAYSLTLQPGETRSIANFVTGQPTRAAAATQAAALALLPANATTCMTPTEVAEIANFAVPAVTNLVTNASFEQGGTAVPGGTGLWPTGWTHNEIGDAPTDGIFCEPDGTAAGNTNAVDGACYYRVVGEGFSSVRTEEGYKYLRQVILTSGAAGDNFTLSGWAKSTGALAAARKKFALRATFKNSGAGSQKYYLNFTRGVHDWELKSRNFNTTAAYRKITLEVEYFGQAGVAFFDGINLIQN